MSPCEAIQIQPDAQSDELLLDGVPDFISLPGLLKATPAEESGHRYLYFEASNEDVDHSNEIVLQKALSDSADYYLRHGNVDVSHYSLLKEKSGVPNFLEYEIGRPVDVRVGSGSTFVKAELYSGDSPMAKNASMIWDSITKQTPPSRWYPSVGGKVLAKSVRVDPATGDKVGVVEKVLWNNTALDRCPVNRTIPEVSLAPVGTFAKSMDAFVVKTLTAGYGTDSAALTGGQAIRKQSLHGADYKAFRDRISRLILQNKFPGEVTYPALIAVARSWLSEDVADGYVRQFLNDLQKRRS
ncbi:MAG: hypothetical protein ACU843_15190 [Gammaproteobacteria bacterium]